jgi:hypothetical protein
MGRREKIHGMHQEVARWALSVKPQSCVEYAERFAYWIMSELPPRNMAATMVTHSMTSAGNAKGCRLK